MANPNPPPLPLESSMLRVPVPDPTAMTTDQLRREIAALREIVQVQLDSLNLRAAGLHESMNRRREDLITEVAHLQALHEERFTSIKAQFGEQNRSSAAAIAKSEAAVSRQLDQIESILRARAEGLSDKIDDLRTRLTAIESTRKGMGDLWGGVLAAVAVAISVGSFVVLILSRR